MARHPRFFISDMTQHVIHRGNNRAHIFRSADDYQAFLYALFEASLRNPIKIHAYVLMSNHFHLMVTPGTQDALPAAMQALGRKYVPFFNQRYERTGALYESRYKAMLVDTERYWFTCMRYVEFNPVRAGLVSTPDKYHWSSYSANALGKPDPLVVPHPLYLALGDTPAARQESWRAMCGNPLSDCELSHIRRAINGWQPLGETIPSKVTGI
jgi:putative transposase